MSVSYDTYVSVRNDMRDSLQEKLGRLLASVKFCNEEAGLDVPTRNNKTHLIRDSSNSHQMASGVAYCGATSVR